MSTRRPSHGTAAKEVLFYAAKWQVSTKTARPPPLARIASPPLHNCPVPLPFKNRPHDPNLSGASPNALISAKSVARAIASSSCFSSDADMGFTVACFFVLGRVIFCNEMSTVKREEQFQSYEMVCCICSMPGQLAQRHASKKTIFFWFASLLSNSKFCTENTVVMCQVSQFTSSFSRLSHWNMKTCSLNSLSGPFFHSDRHLFQKRVEIKRQVKNFKENSARKQNTMFGRVQTKPKPPMLCMQPITKKAVFDPLWQNKDVSQRRGRTGSRVETKVRDSNDDGRLLNSQGCSVEQGQGCTPNQGHLNTLQCQNILVWLIWHGVKMHGRNFWQKLSAQTRIFLTRLCKFLKHNSFVSNEWQNSICHSESAQQIYPSKI